MDCLTGVWSPVLGGRPEPAGSRAPCPSCGSGRALEYDCPGKSVRWRLWCSCDRDEVRAELAARLGDHLAVRATGRAPIDRDALIVLALADLSPKARQLGLLELAGISTAEALDMLGIDRTSRYRLRAQLSQFRDKTAGR